MPALRSRYGEVRDQVIAWLEEQPLESEFRGSDVAEELNLQKPSVSGVLNSLMRADNPILGPGRISGRFRVIRPVEEILPAAYREPPALAGDPASRRPVAGSSMEVIGVLKDGNVMLRAKDDSLWEASPR